MQPKRPWWHRALLYAGLVLLGYLVLCGVLAWTYVHPHRLRSPAPEGLRHVQVAPNIVVNATPDVLVEGSVTETVFVFVHGYGGHADEWAEFQRDLAAEGFGSVAKHMRAHGMSPESASGFSVREANDLALVLGQLERQHALSRPPRFILVGLSLGGATVWRTAKQRPDNIVAVVSEGCFSRFDAVARRWFDRLMPQGSVVFRPVIEMASLFAGVSMASIRPADDARSWRGKPGLVIQAEFDVLVPMQDAESIANAAGVPLWRVSDAPHAGASGFAYKEYLAKLKKLALE